MELMWRRAGPQEVAELRGYRQIQEVHRRPGTDPQVELINRRQN